METKRKDETPSIVIIEDDRNLLEGLVLYLEMHGYRVFGTMNGLAGIELIRSHRPDVVITNFQMPGADGFEVLQFTRGEAAIASTPIIFITADHALSVREEAVRIGADVFLTKPFRTSELLDQITRLIGQSYEETITTEILPARARRP